MKSRLAEQARRDQIEQARRMTPEQRVRAYFELSRSAGKLYAAGRRDRRR